MLKKYSILLAALVLTIATGCGNKESRGISVEDSVRIAEDAKEKALAEAMKAEKESREAEPEQARAASPDPVTQYLFVEYSPSVGTYVRDNLAKILKARNFKVTQHPAPIMLDSPEDDDFVLLLEATRQEPEGKTSITQEICDTGDRVTIRFASTADVDAFVESLAKANYRKLNNYYAYPRNSASSKYNLYIKVKGTKAIIRSQYGNGKPRF